MSTLHLSRENPGRAHWWYLKTRKSGMEPWFQFWDSVTYAIEKFKIEWANHKTYMRTGGAS